MTAEELLSRLQLGPLLADGSTGAELSRRGMSAGVCTERWILENEAVFTALQQDYVRAGSRMLLTPTFGASRIKLAEYGLGDDTEEYNHRLGQLTRRVAIDGILSAAELGPTGVFVAPLGTIGFEELVSVFREQVRGLLQAQPDLFILETFLDLSEIRAAILAIRELSDLPIIASMTFENGHTLTGSSPEAVAQALLAAGADVVGANCSSGPAELGAVLAVMATVTPVPLFAKPNAGLPFIEDGKTVFPMGPDEFAAGFDTIFSAGARIVGGCCGAGPDHVAALHARLAGYTPRPLPNCPSFISGARSLLPINPDKEPTLVGRMIFGNSEALRNAMTAEDEMELLDLAREYKALGAKALEIDCAAPGLDEYKCLRQAVEQISAMLPLPLILTAQDPKALEAALRRYPGRAGVCLYAASQEAFPAMMKIVRRYGALPLLTASQAAGWEGEYICLLEGDAPASCTGLRRAVLISSPEQLCSPIAPGTELVLADLGNEKIVRALGLE